MKGADERAADPTGLGERPGLRVIDWNKDRRVQGTVGYEIATLFSLVIGEASDPNAARLVHARMYPGGPPRLWHAHPGWTATIVLEGSMTIEGAEFTAGQMMLVEPGVAYGPITPGPEGASFIEVFSGAAATATIWDEADRRVAEYRRKGWILDHAPSHENGT